MYRMIRIRDPAGLRQGLLTNCDQKKDCIKLVADLSQTYDRRAGFKQIFSKVQVMEFGLRDDKPKLDEQESCAIAKTTARCALYIAALKILESP